MKHTIMLNSALLILHSLIASPFAPEPTVECVVYSDAKSDQPLHVEQWTTNGSPTGRRWEFPASYSGHHSVCRLPGASTNDTFVAWFGGDSYEPGDMFGASLNRYGYHHGINDLTNLEIGVSWPILEMTKTSPICPRINVWNDTSDRGLTIDDELYFEGDRPAGPGSSGTNIRQPSPEELGESVRVRVVRYAMNDIFTYSKSVQNPNRVIIDKTFRKSSRNFLCEADLLGDGEFDVEWSTLKDEVTDPTAANNYHVTNMSYLVVIGDGPCGFDRYNATNESDRVTALKTIITRRFDAGRKSPVLTGVDHLIKGNHPVFSWSMPDESIYARKFGSSYTAFRLQIVIGGSTGGEGGKLVLTTDVIRAPRQRADGNFVWTAPFSVGDSSYLGSMFNSNTNFSWRVSMYNSKFKPAQSVAGDRWSDVGYFVTHHQD